jgi:hypothetical protein
VNEIFYDFSCYDALDFEILCIRRVRDTLKELLDIKNSRFTESEVTERMNRFLNLMLIARYCQLAETLAPEAEIAELQTQGDEVAESKEGGGEIEQPPAEE